MEAITKDIGPFKPLPEGIRNFLQRYHADGIDDEECVTCNSACCSQGGFALLENVVLIHKAYERGLLKRKDYEFKPGFSFGEFVFDYFDIRTYAAGGEDLVLFHMRNLALGRQIIKLPEEGSYWETRAKLFEEARGLNQGCVFLSEKTTADPSSDENTDRHCILHVPESPDHLTAKPVDCLFFTCATRPGDFKRPTPEDTAHWMSLLAKNYPDSIERLKKMLMDGQATSKAPNP
jgi:hypothetical protein